MSASWPASGRGSSPAAASVPPRGPSPRAGGKQAQIRAAFRSLRTIPPGRGETMGSSMPRHGESDHPPGQGGNAIVVAGKRLFDGPSPRAGGKLRASLYALAHDRTIPPGRGETGEFGGVTSRDSDHPPGQGGNRGVWRSAGAGCGPSPRAGGKPLKSARTAKLPRTIPPGRGETPGVQ